MFSSNADTIRQRTTAMAGVLQALILMQEQANIQSHPQSSKYYMYTSTRSILILSPNSVDEIYDGINGVQRGLKAIININGAVFAHNELIGYLFNILRITQQLYQRNHNALKQTLRKELEKSCQKHLRHISKTREQENIAFYSDINGLYYNTIRKLPHSIKLFGHPDRLSVPAVTYKLRTLLMAAIRSAVLWRQYGGSMFGLALERQQVFGQAQLLLRQIKNDTKILESK